MEWSCLVLLECRAYGRQTSDMNIYLAETREKLISLVPSFSVVETPRKNMRVLQEDVEEAEERGFLVSYDNFDGVPHVVMYTEAFTKQCGSLEEAVGVCNLVERDLPDVFTSIQIIQSAWLDRAPH